MDEIKHLKNPRNVLQISKALQKVSKAIEQHKKDQGKVESTLTELVFLKEQCLSKNAQLSLLSCHTLFELIECGVIEPAAGLTTFITMLSGASSSEQLAAIGEGIINILLLDLKIAAALSRSKSVPYDCPFGLKTAQHPIITLLQKKNLNVLDLTGKLGRIHKHTDERIRSNSMEFLRPVYSFLFCNPNNVIESTMIWKDFLEQQSTSDTFLEILYDVFRWSRITSEKVLCISTEAIDVIKMSLSKNQSKIVVDFQMYLMALIQSLLELGYDPRNSFDVIIRTIELLPEEYVQTELLDFNLISMSKIVHIIPPFYLNDALRVVKVLSEKGKTKNYLVLNMVLGALILRLAINGKNLPPKVVAEMNRLINQMSKQTVEYAPSKQTEITNDILFFHPKLIFNWNLTKLSSKLCDEFAKKELVTLDHLIDVIESSQPFSEEIHLFLRALLLSNKLNFDSWLKIFNQLLHTAQSNPDISCDTIYFVLYYLAKETDGKKQLELLRGLTTFASVKENIPLIMNTYRSLSTSSAVLLRCLAVDLHTRLWRIESRTYQFLQKILIEEDTTLSKADQWEMNVAKANAIKEICTIKASQHGTDLVAPLSKILNNSADNDLARSWALDAVILLCKSHTVNISSTWKVLRGTFDSKMEVRTTKSLCAFFGEVPLLKSATNEYEQLYKEAHQRLWTFVTNSDQAEVIQQALLALRNYDFTELTLKHIPSLFYENIHIPKEFQKQIEDSKTDSDSKPLTVEDVVPYIPGECWIEFLQKINENASEDAIDFVAHLIETEMLQYRSGVYMLPEGRPEPNDMKQLHVRSPLRALIKYIKDQSEWNTESALAVKALKCIGKKYSRPMPPLNWFFLIEYINHSMKFVDSNATERFEMKIQALYIAGNQTAHSGSARNLIENYLQQFHSSTIDLEETLILVKLIPNVCFGVSPRILAAALRNSLTFLYQHSASSRFEEHSHFEQAIAALADLFELKCTVAENVDIVLDELCRFNEILDGHSKVYERYAECLLKLPSETFDRLCTPNDWIISNFHKALIFRMKAVSSKKVYPGATNPWMWLNSLIDNISDAGDPVADRERKEVLLSKISELVLKDETSLCEWIVYYLGKVQSNFSADTSSSRIEHNLYCLDLFIYCIVFSSGCSVFLDNEFSLKSRLQWLNKLPEALWLLTNRKCWSDHLPRIFEFLYHLNTQSEMLPKEYVTITGRALVCVKNHEYFLQKSTWTKFFSLKT